MSQKIILGLVGEIASGKSTVTDYIKQKYGAVSFRFSDILAGESVGTRFYPL
jgi:dephospho-CoA kinase